MKISIKFLVFVASLSFLNNSIAETLEDKRVLINGLATLSCGKLLENYDNEIAQAQLSDWLNGYITSYNYYNIDQQVSAPDKPTSIFFIKNYCSKNVLSNLLSGGAVLVQDLGGPKVKFPYLK